MATTIKLKNGSGAPLAGDLVQGEPALDLTNKRLYTEDSGGTVIEIGTSPSTIDINAGTIDGTVIGGASAAAGTFTTFTSTGIDDNATSTAITIDSSQNVGIGVAPTSAWSTSSYKALDINTSSIAAASSTFALLLNAYNDGFTWRYKGTGTASLYYQASGNHVWQYAASGTAGNAISFNEAMRIDSSGNVGIGTTSNIAGVGLELKKSGSYIGLNTTTVGYSLIRGYDNGTERWSIGQIGFGGADGFAVYTGTANTERMRIDSSGNVGIGTTAPSVASGSGLAIYDASASRLTLKTAASGDSSGDGGGLVLSGSTLYLEQRESDSLVFSTAATERARIDSSGKLLVGTTSSTYHTITLNNSSNYAAGVVNTSSSAPYAMVLYLSGVTGGAGAGFLTCVDNGNRLLIRGDGDVENANNSYGAFSDARLKSNIVDASSQLDDIMAVQVRSYTLNETGDTHIGVVAQELEASGMSGLVKTDDEGMKSVKYSILYMKAIKALQEAVTRIETLEAEVAALKGE